MVITCRMWWKPLLGLDGCFLTIISLAYAEEKWTKEDGTEDSRVVLRIPAKIAPTKLAILRY